MSTIAVFGCGFVGGTVADYLEKYTDHNVIRIDPVRYPENDKEEAKAKADGFVIAVPTPQADDGFCDDSIVRAVIKDLGPDKPILIKSTVAPDKMDSYPANVCYNPEFLRERCAMEDFMRQNYMIFGHDFLGQPDAEWWAKIMISGLEHDCEIMYTDRATASAIKYVHNSWLATKVAFFHELYAKLPDNIHYYDLTDALSQFPHVGPSHMTAPNHEGKLGYSGACFPKDVSAMIHYCPDLEILSHVHKVNDDLQNIN
jgi:UDPglucose 6-dehydrogenase